MIKGMLVSTKHEIIDVSIISGATKEWSIRVILSSTNTENDLVMPEKVTNKTFRYI